MKCPICNNKKHKLIQAEVWGDLKKSVYKCLSCEIVFLFPQMTEEELKNFYQNYQKHINKRLPNKLEIAEIENKQRAAAKRQVSSLKKHLSPKLILCDIGASNGYFLQRAKKYVKKVIAIEPGKNERKKLSNQNIEHYPWLDDINNKSLKFDNVSMFHTFEHIDKPLQFLSKLKNYLNKNGFVFVELPNIDDALVSKYKLKAFNQFYFQPMHFFYYNETTLANVFKKSGFKLVECIYLQRYPFSNHFEWLMHGKPGGNKEYEKKFNKINKNFEQVLKEEKATDTIMCVFKTLN